MYTYIYIYIYILLIIDIIEYNYCLSKYCYLQANSLILFRIYFYNNVAFVYWRLRTINRNLQCDSLSL